MDEYTTARVKALRDALQDEVHGLWISDEMAVKVLLAVDAVMKKVSPKPPVISR